MKVVILGDGLLGTELSKQNKRDAQNKNHIQSLFELNCLERVRLIRHGFPTCPTIK